MLKKWIGTSLFALLLIGCAATPTETLAPPVSTSPTNAPAASATSKPAMPTLTPMPSSLITARLNEPFTLKLLQSAILSDAKNTQVSVTTLVGDSRCPTGVNCVQIGGVRVMVNLETGDMHRVARFDISTAPQDRRDVGAFGGYLLRIVKVEPYPDQLNVQIPRADYRVTLLVTQGSIRTLTPKIGEPFALKLGQTASITGTDATLKFEAVTQDSRCPIHAACASSGKAIVTVTLQHDGQSEFFSLDSETNFAVKGNSPTISYAVYFNALTPYPQNEFASKEIDQSDYEATFVVWK